MTKVVEGPLNCLEIRSSGTPKQTIPVDYRQARLSINLKTMDEMVWAMNGDSFLVTYSIAITALIQKKFWKRTKVMQEKKKDYLTNKKREIIM
jgi:hypothetical protein